MISQDYKAVLGNFCQFFLTQLVKVEFTGYLFQKASKKTFLKPNINFSLIVLHLYLLSVCFESQLSQGILFSCLHNFI